MQIFQLKTVMYETISASVLASACLGKIADDEYINFPEVCRAIKIYFYMDDYFGGTNTKKIVVRLRDNLRKVYL